MIKVIGQNNLLKSSIWEESSIKECLDYFKDHKGIAVDTETQGRDPHTKNILSLQIGDSVHQWVIDVRRVPILLFKDLLESKLCLIHNVSFDYKFLKKSGIVLKDVWDTCITEAILYRGIQNKGYSLQDVCERYTGERLNKDVRGDFFLVKEEPFTDAQIEYASKDVKYLHNIATQQYRKATENGVLISVLEDNRAILAYADMEYYGNKIDAQKWLENASNNEIKLRKLVDDLDSLVEVKPTLSKYVLNTYQGDLFDDSVPRRVIINWDSNQQVLKLFNELGIGGGKLTSVEAPLLKPYAENDFIKTYLEMSKQAKAVSTYGKSFINTCLNQSTKRVHTSYWIALNTGRCSSGGGRLQPEYPNMQNIPNTEVYRSMFISEPGNVLITCDYSQLEPRVLADLCQDPTMIDLFVNGDGDTHTMTANALYSVLEGKPVSIDKKDPRRQIGKVLNLKLNYGGSAFTVKDDLKKSLEETQVFIDALDKAFPKKKEWQIKAKEKALKDGFIVLDEVHNSKCYIDKFEDFLVIQNTIKDKNFWPYYKHIKEIEGSNFINHPIREFASNYFKWKGNIERAAINYPCQGRAAAIVKRAMVLVRSEFIKNNIYDIAMLINQVHDELVAECPVEISEKVAWIMKDCMIEAGKYFCKSVPMKIEPNIQTYWAK